MAALTQLIIDENKCHKYTHFGLGKKDDESRGLRWFTGITIAYIKWMWLVLTRRRALIHFNLALDSRALIRDVPLILASRLLRKPMLVHLHGGELLMRETIPLWQQWLLTLALSGGHPKIVLGPLEQDALNKKLVLRKVFVLPNCIRLNEPRRFERTYPKDEPLQLLFMGRLSRAKGLDVILAALEILKYRGRRFRFSLAGKGPDESSYVQRFSELLGNSFEFMGVVADDKKSQLLMESNVFLLPSFFEGLPMALLESMSFGLVPITTNVGSIGTVVVDQSNGLIINKGAPHELVTALERLACDKGSMERLSRSARLSVDRKFGSEPYINRLNDIYQYEYRY